MLIENRALHTDPWTVVADDEPLIDGLCLVSLKRWQVERESLLASHAGRLGVIVNAGSVKPADVGVDAGHFAVIAFDFPNLADGRAFSHAALLRGRYGYTGQLRAMGKFLPDQLLYLERCGFDAFVLSPPHEPAACLRFFDEFSASYQCARDQQTPVAALRKSAQQ